ncbi:hypothetical protein V5O48_014885 [Marasmius crinis-equi]|uniref:Uncharacterized protein n=1 Tax=Marasmius crinis-equi TaxID=585013 RepID=A0ABR3EW25_9AGAR
MRCLFVIVLLASVVLAAPVPAANAVERSEADALFNIVRYKRSDADTDVLFSVCYKKRDSNEVDALFPNYNHIIKRCIALVGDRNVELD